MTATASLFVCTGCLDAPDHFIATLRAQLTGSGCTVKPVECLAVCEGNVASALAATFRRLDEDFFEG